jgi:ketosteroid isomerase-like protein
MRSAGRNGRPRSPGAVPCRIALATSLALTLALACGHNTDADRDEVKGLVAREVAAVNSRDMQALAQIWAQDDDILLFDVAPPGRFQGWPAIARSFNDFFQRLSDVTMGVENLSVSVDGSLAAATYDWTLAGKLDGRALADRGEATALYRRGKDGWRLVHEHFSPSPRGAAPAGAAGGTGGSGAGAAPAPGDKPATPDGTGAPAGAPAGGAKTGKPPGKPPAKPGR